MHCPDQKGIIADVTQFIHESNGNIIYIDQYVDRVHQSFFMRVVVESLFQKITYEDFQTTFNRDIGSRYTLRCSFFLEDKIPNVAVFVSKYDHCLYDILTQQRSGKLACTIPFILSNHKDLESVAKQFQIPFYHVPVTKETKAEAETQQLELLKKHQIDSIVLARYMQIVSHRLVDAFPTQIINLHHSLLPAFPGAKPYHSAFERGVKIIGATSHYVTEDLDAGPIIEQDIVRVSHEHEVRDFIEKGQDLERIVLLRALKNHCDRKIMVYQNKTVVFN